MKPLILISNDDGYHAKGMHSLIKFIRDLGDIIVCAPESVRSGYSRAFSATTPLTLKEREIKVIAPIGKDDEGLTDSVPASRTLLSEASTTVATRVPTATIAAP